MVRIFLDGGQLGAAAGQPADCLIGLPPLRPSPLRPSSLPPSRTIVCQGSTRGLNDVTKYLQCRTKAAGSVNWVPSYIYLFFKTRLSDIRITIPGSAKPDSVTSV